MEFVHNLSFNDTVTEYIKGNVVLEDVLVSSSFDGTSHEVTLCGPYGWELVSLTISDSELTCLKSDLSDLNFIINED